MPLEPVNGVQLFWEQRGAAGAPIVFVHGSWGDHHNWDAVVPAFARSYRVFTYDRRGHSQSERPAGQGRLEEDVDDLAAFLRAKSLAPAHVVGNSGGAAIALKLAAAEPELFASLVAHEPPLVGMIQDHPMMSAVRQRIGAVVALLRAGDMEAGARQFVETIAFGPGSWTTLPPEIQQTFVFNAPTFLDEQNEPEGVMSVDLHRLAAFSRPMLLSQGDHSAPFFGAIVQKIADALPAARRHTFQGAGHVPHLTIPDDYCRVVGEFLESTRAA
jgi:pimeloyl-ACP methyl ester carboxylesterase